MEYRNEATETLEPGSAGFPVGQLLRAALPPALTFLVLTLVWQRMDEIGSPVSGTDLVRSFAHVGGIPLWAWLGAAALSGLSFAALGQYEALCHRALSTGVAAPVARKTGIAALAISQTVGVGLISGTLLRWRLMPWLPRTKGAALTALMSTTFMMIWAALVVAAFAVLPGTLPEMVPGWAPAAAAATALAALALALGPGRRAVILRRSLGDRGLGLRTQAMFGLYAAVDMSAAGIGLWLLAGPALGVPLDAFVPPFLLALGLGLMAGTPAGLGAFDIALFALLPGAEPVVLLSGIIAYRALWFALPAILALPAVLQGGGAAPIPRDLTWQRSDARGRLSPVLERALSEAPLAEAQLARLPGHGLLWSESAHIGGVVARAGRTLVMLRDPFPAIATDAIFDGLHDLAEQRGLTPCLYKCSARVAVQARNRGHRVLLVSREAVITPAEYDTSTRSRRQLRRFLRKGEQAGLRIECPDPRLLPLGAMAAVNTDWSAAHGGERGFSMGCFDPGLVGLQRIYLAWDGDRLVGFVTFHTVASEWTLDLLRPAPDAPPGTAHLLIDRAVQDAAELGLPRLSLAAAPHQAEADGAAGEAFRRLKARLDRHAGGEGLRRFKEMFAPRWEPLYLTAPTRWGLLRAGTEIARAVSRPRQSQAHEADSSGI